jgi:hypothetical protein
MRLTLTFALLTVGLLGNGALAAPAAGRRENPDLPMVTSGILAVHGVNSAVGYTAELALPDDIATIKSMGDRLLSLPKGSKQLGLIEFEWRPTNAAPKRIYSFTMWIDGDYSPEMLLPGFDTAGANVEYCRAIGMAYIGDIQFTPTQLKEIFNQETPQAFPHHNSDMRSKHAWAEIVATVCKRRNSPKWAFVRGGSAIGGQDEWVYIGDYGRDTVETGRPTWIDIPNHRRSEPALNRLRDRPYYPVNNYDAALAPTPGDTEGMKDIYPESRGK